MINLLTCLLDESLKAIQLIFSGLVKIANLVPCSEKESSFVGIYASTSPGKKQYIFIYIYIFTLNLKKNFGVKKDAFMTEIGKYRFPNLWDK